MADQTPELAGLLDETLGLLQQSLKQAEVLEGDKAALKKKLAAKESEEQVLLEKVAASNVRPAFSEKATKELLTAMEKQLNVSQADREKIASGLREDPDTALTIARKLIDLSTPAHSEGNGVAKNATESSPDPDGWGKCQARR